MGGAALKGSVSGVGRGRSSLGKGSAVPLTLQFVVPGGASLHTARCCRHLGLRYWVQLFSTRSSGLKCWVKASAYRPPWASETRLRPREKGKKKKRLDFIFYPDSVFILQELIVGFAGDRSLLCLSPRSLWGPPRSWGALRGEGPLSAALWCPNSPGLEKAMAPHSSTLAWKIPWMEEPGRLQSMGSLGVGHDWVTWLSLFTFMHWRRKW